MAEKSYLTRYTIALFKDIVVKENTTDIPCLIYAVSTRLEELYEGPYLEFRLARIGLQTTNDIRDALYEFLEKYHKFLIKKGVIPGDDYDDQEA